MLKNYNQNKNDGIRSLDTFSLNRDDEIETLDTISVDRDDFTIESRFDAHKNIQDKFNFVAESVVANNKFLLQHHCNLSKADKNQN